MDRFQFQGQKVFLFTGKLKIRGADKEVLWENEKQGWGRKKKCLIIKRSSAQFAEEVIESPITVIASHLFLLMWFSVKGEQPLVWNHWTLLRLNGNEMKHRVIKEGIRPRLDTKEKNLWYSKKPTEVDFFLWKLLFFFFTESSYKLPALMERRRPRSATFSPGKWVSKVLPAPNKTLQTALLRGYLASDKRGVVVSVLHNSRVFFLVNTFL